MTELTIVQGVCWMFPFWNPMHVVDIKRGQHKTTMLFLKSSLFLLLCAFAMAIVIKLGVFNKIQVDLGYEHYAEKTCKDSMIKMPFNAYVNLGYVLVGLFWIWKTRSAKLTRADTFYFDIFSIMAVIYGPIQFARIVTQLHVFAVLDQWVTLPFFSWVYVWGCHLMTDFILTWSKLAFIMVMSVATFFITLSTPVGFEYALGFHILLVFSTVCSLQYQHGNRLSFIFILYGIIFCFGFVSLKLIDHHLLQVHWIFSRASGHFWSKICDILQIHVTSSFFLEIVKTTHKYV